MERQLARMEANQEAMLEELRKFIELQEKHNEVFYTVRDSVRDMQAKASGAWFTVGLFGSLTLSVSALVSWLVSQWRQ